MVFISAEICCISKCTRVSNEDMIPAQATTMLKYYNDLNKNYYLKKNQEFIGIKDRKEEKPYIWFNIQ